MGATGYGAAQGLETVLSRLFQEAQAKQQAQEAQSRLELQQKQLEQQDAYQRASLGMQGTKIAQDAAAMNMPPEPAKPQTMSINGRIVRINPDGTAQEIYAAPDKPAEPQRPVVVGRSLVDPVTGKRIYRDPDPVSGSGDPKPTPAASPYAAERNQRAVDAVDALSNKVSNWTAGPGSMLGVIPGTDATDFGAELDTLKANIAFNELAQMREASKTGGALGAISERELALLESSLGALNPRQSPDNLKAQLAKVKESLVRWQQAQAASGLGVPMQTSGAPRQAPTSTGPVRWRRGPNGVPVKVQ